MDLGDFETTIKVIVVGNGGVGKSSMTSRYCKGVYTDTYKKTIGVDFLEKSIVVDEAGGETVKLMIWDTAGQEEFDALTAGYYRGAGACAIVFSTIDRASFEAVDKWKKKVEDECGPIAMVLVQNKVDLADSAAMTAGEAEAVARRLGVRLYRSCVKDNVNVSDVFDFLAAQFILKGDASGVSALPVAGDYRPGATPSPVLQNGSSNSLSGLRGSSSDVSLVAAVAGVAGAGDGGVAGQWQAGSRQQGGSGAGPEPSSTAGRAGETSLQAPTASTSTSTSGPSMQVLAKGAQPQGWQDAGMIKLGAEVYLGIPAPHPK